MYIKPFYQPYLCCDGLTFEVLRSSQSTTCQGCKDDCFRYDTGLQGSFSVHVGACQAMAFRAERFSVGMGGRTYIIITTFARVAITLCATRYRLHCSMDSCAGMSRQTRRHTDIHTYIHVSPTRESKENRHTQAHGQSDENVMR